MSTPVVVQGTAVGNPAAAPQQQQSYAGPDYNNNNDNGGIAHPHGGEKAETRCNDPIFALLFYACIGAIVAVAAIYGPAALAGTSSSSTINYEPIVVYVIIVAVISFLASALGLAVMMCIPETLIKIALIFTVIMSAVWAAMAFVSGQIGIGVIGVIFFLITCCYAWAVWSRIPFATANLVTSITAIKANLGVCAYAYIITFVAMAWSICWSVAFAGVFDLTYVCDDRNVCSNPNYGYLFLLFLAFFFGHQVFQVRYYLVCRLQKKTKTRALRLLPFGTV